MNRVYISVGSNQDTVRHVRSALDALHQRFGDLAISSVYESEAVGFDGENFLNLVVGWTRTNPLPAWRTGSRRWRTAMGASVT